MFKDLGPPPGLTLMQSATESMSLLIMEVGGSIRVEEKSTDFPLQQPRNGVSAMGSKALKYYIYFSADSHWQGWNLENA